MISLNGFSPDSVMANLNRAIDMVVGNIGAYCVEPGITFTRRRKLPPDILIRYLIQLEGKGTPSEICSFFEDEAELPSSQAVCMRRNQLDADALRRIMELFSVSCIPVKYWKNWIILAADGSEVRIFYDPDDKETLKRCGDNSFYSAYHINGLYDCCNNTYRGFSIDPPSKSGESEALRRMIAEHNYPDNSIIVADRGYERYELMAQCNEMNQKYVIRCKDINSNGILRHLELPDQDVDETVTIRLTKSQKYHKQSDSKVSVFIPSTSSFEYLDITEDYYEMTFRVIRFRLTSGEYECLVTNLWSDEMPAEEFMDIYHMRWAGIENGFRELKHTIGLKFFHCKKRNSCRQEIYARVIMYNFASYTTTCVEAAEISGKNRSEVKNKPEKKPKTRVTGYKANRTAAFTSVRMFLRGRLSGKKLIKRIKKYLVPIRPDRSFVRNIRTQPFLPYVYRAS